MARDLLNIQYPILDHTESVANICIEKTKVNSENGITIENAFSSMNKNLFIIINNFGKLSTLTIVSGNTYPNSMLGDINIELATGISAIQLKDLSRFEKEDCSLDLDFAPDFDGEIYAIAHY